MADYGGPSWISADPRRCRRILSDLPGSRRILADLRGSWRIPWIPKLSFADVLLYVDEILVVDRTNVDMSSNTRISDLTPPELIIEKLMERFKMVNLGSAKTFVGMELVKRGDGYDLHQEGYIDSMLDRYGQANAAGYITPTDTHVDLFRSKNVEDRALDDQQRVLY